MTKVNVTAANATKTNGTNGTKVSTGNVVSEIERKCYHQHNRICKYFPKHPLIRENEYYVFKDEYIVNIQNETLRKAKLLA